MSEDEVKKLFYDVDVNLDGDNIVKGLIVISKRVDLDVVQVIKNVSNDRVTTFSIAEALQLGLTKHDFEKLAGLNWIIESGQLCCHM